MTNNVTNKFIEDFWKWFKEHHEKRYRKEGKELTPDFKFHEKHMKFSGYEWDWVAIFVKECYDLKTSKGESQ